MSATRIWQNFKELLDVSWGSITDGQTLKRSGSNIIGYTPAGGSGDVVGPASAVSGNIATYNGTTGKIIQDGSKLGTDLVTGPASATTGNIASYNGTTGKIIQDGAKLAADLVTGPASATSGNIASFNGTTGKIVQDGAKAVSALGDTFGQGSSVDSEIALFSGTGGKTIKRATGTGYVTVVNGVYQAPTTTDMAGRMPRGQLWGLTMSNNGSDLVNDIDVAVGEARDSTNAVDMVLGSAITKRLDAVWAVGTNQGGLDTGTIANNTYHVWLIERTDGTVVDVLFSLSATAPTMPANYTYKRRIGSIMRVAAAIVRFVQHGDWFDRYDWADNTVAAGSVTANTLVTVTLGIPTGIKFYAHLLGGTLKSAANPFSRIVSLDTSPVVGFMNIWSATSSAYGQTVLDVWTNTSAQVGAMSDTTGATISIYVMGWMDTRGRID
jgi:hypothetical protein